MTKPIVDFQNFSSPPKKARVFLPAFENPRNSAHVHKSDIGVIIAICRYIKIFD